MTFLSSVKVAASIADFSVKKLFNMLVGNTTVAALGSTYADAAPLTSGKNLVTASNGALGVKLPVAEVGMAIEVINTVSNGALLVYPNTSAQINALTATTQAFTQAAGSRALYVCDVPLHWYVAAANLTGTATSASQAELDQLASSSAANATTGKAAILGTDGAITFGGAVTAVGSFIIGSADLSEADMEKLDGITNGTQAASKAVVANSDVNIGITKVTELHIGSTGAETQVNATAAELNMAADNSANVEVVAATNIVTAAESGKTFFLNHATEFVSTLPVVAAGLRYTFIVTGAPSGASYTVVTDSAAQVLGGHVLASDGNAGDVEAPAAGTTITFVDGAAVAGDRVDVICDGTSWYARCTCAVATGITITG